MRIVGILALVGSVLFTNIAFADSMFDLGVRDFILQPWQDCNSDVHCDVVQPKEWSTEESEVIFTAIQKFKFGGLRGLLNQIKSLGFNSFERATYWYTIDFNPQTLFAINKSEYTYAITYDVGPNTIVLMDAFFKEPLEYDPLTQVDRKEITLLHELSHAFDYKNRFSNSEEFLNLAGFQRGLSSIPIFQKRTSGQIADLNKEYFKLREKGLYNEAELFSRKSGMKYGLPRIYSMTNPGEAFADLVAFIYYDRDAPLYISSTLIAYIDSNVLHGARGFTSVSKQ